MTIEDQKKQPQNVLAEYAEYVEGKIDMGEVPLAFCDWAGIEFDEASPISKFILADHPAQVKPTPGTLPEKLDVHSTGLFPMKAEIHPVNDPDGLEILADVLTMELADELVRRYNAFPGMLEALKEAKKYRLQTHHGDDKLLAILEAAIKSATK